MVPNELIVIVLLIVVCAASVLAENCCTRWMNRQVKRNKPDAVSEPCNIVPFPSHNRDIPGKK
jgi:hypothetical protein